MARRSTHGLHFRRLDSGRCHIHYDLVPSEYLLPRWNPPPEVERALPPPHGSPRVFFSVRKRVARGGPLGCAMDVVNSIATSAHVEPVPPTPRAVSVVVPAYNEERGIRPVLASLVQTMSSLPAVTYEIIVVDDGSTDGTSEAVRGLPGVSVVRHDSNRGYGAALKTGLRHARYDWICITDADGTYPNERIGDLLAATEGAHMVVGARTAPGAQDSWLRRLPRTFLRRYAAWVTRRRIDDLNSGLRVFRKDLAERFLHLLPDGFSFTTTITIADTRVMRMLKYWKLMLLTIQKNEPCS